MKTLKSVFEDTCRQIERQDVILMDEGNTSQWDEVLAAAGFVPVQYTRFWMDYQRRYMETRGEGVIEYCLVFRNNGKPAAIWPVSVLLGKGANAFGHLNDRIVPPLLVSGLSTREERKIYDKCWDILVMLAERFAVNGAEFVHDYYGPSISVSGFQKYLCEKGAETHLMHGLVVDLGLSAEKLAQNIRKSYKSLINEGKRSFDYSMYDGDGFGGDVFEEVRALHLRMAGRETRSRDSWLEQEKWVRASNAMLNSVHRDGKLIGASLFPFTRDMAVYQIGVYDRRLFDMPIAHVLLSEAIGYFREKGLKLLYLGLRHYEGDYWARTDEKGRNISYFKEGFATGNSLHVYQKVRFGA